MKIQSSKTLQISVALLVAACSSGGNGPTFSQNNLPHLSNKARVVVYRPGSFSGGLRAPTIDLNGQAVCDMVDNSYFVRDTSGV